MARLLRSVCLAGLLAAAAPNEDVARCMTLERQQCDPDRSCEGVRFGGDRACLEAAVPWRTPYATVRCCFKCCLAYWYDALGLTAAQQAWPKNQRQPVDEV